MNVEEWAQMLNGREYGNEVTLREDYDAGQDGIVIIYGQSDDLMEFRGAINDEEDCYNGGTVYIDPDTKKLFKNDCGDGDCPYAEKLMLQCPKIVAVWGDSHASWVYETDIPHETFNIFDDGELYCVGIVFDVSDL